MFGILTYHSLDDSGSVISVSPALFAAQMAQLHGTGVRVVPLDEMFALPTGQETDRARVALTFDDGFANFFDHGWPVLRHYGFPATVFLVTDHCGSDNDWPSQPAEVERRALLTWSQVRALSAEGVSFGCHTRSHPDLTRLSLPEIDDELSNSKSAIESAVGKPVTTLAYPYGAFDPAVRARAAEYFKLGVSTTLGFATETSDRLALERLDTYYLRNGLLFRRLFSPGVRSYLSMRRMLRTLRSR